MSCGTGKIIDVLIPDNLLGLDISCECHEHDVFYEQGESWAEKRWADDKMHHLFKEAIYAVGGELAPERLKLAKQYHRAVRWFGWISFGRILRRKKREGLA